MNVLFISAQAIADKIQSGGRQVSRRNYEMLCRTFQNDNLYRIIPSENKRKIADKTLFYQELKNTWQRLIAALFLCKTYMPWNEQKIASYVKDIQPDLLFLDTSMLGKLLRHKKLFENAKVVVFFHNIEHDYAWHKVEKEGIPYIFSFIASAYNEKIAVKRADKIICINGRDARRLEELYGKKADLLLPVSFEDNFNIHAVNRNINDKTLLFIGSYFAPNYHGIKWFVENVMSDMPDYKLVIVGKGFEEKKTELERENVSIVGTAVDLASYYYCASAMVMPILYGEGMKVKTAEAMMYGMTIFATSEALEGYDVDGLRGIHRCNTKEAFMTSIQEYYEGGKAETYNDDIRECFLDKYESRKQVEKAKVFFENMKQKIETK